MKTFDVAVIGAGPGGFDAALGARELGFSVALIDKSDLGGTCLNTGCIPTKSLLASTKFLTRMKHAEVFGLSTVFPVWDISSLIQRKNRIVDSLKKAMTETLNRSGVEWVSGEASFTGKGRLQIVPAVEIESKYVIIATGSVPLAFPGTPFDGERILSSADLLEIKTPPRDLLILGGGVVGVEFASIFQALGVRVTIVEMLERLLAGEDPELGRRLESLYQRKGVQVLTGEKVQNLAVQTNGVEALLESGKKLTADHVLVATGRRPRVENLGLEKAGIKFNKKGIEVNEYLETSAPNIFAIGDVTNRTTGLAHGATAEGIRVAENLKGPPKKMNYEAIPNCIYSDPEVASVGIYRSGRGSEEIVECKILFSSIGKSQVEGETEGFLKMAASKKTGKILGVAGIGAHVTELIHEAVLAIKAGLTVQTLAETIHAHPTESEILQKAAQKLAVMTAVKRCAVIPK